MRLSVTSLRRMVKRPLHVEFGPQQLTCQGELEAPGDDAARQLREAERLGLVDGVPIDGVKGTSAGGSRRRAARSPGGTEATNGSLAVTSFTNWLG